MATIAVELQPFSVPNFVLATPKRIGNRQDGFHEAQKYALSELDEKTLGELCDKFRADVFSKAKYGWQKTLE